MAIFPSKRDTLRRPYRACFSLCFFFFLETLQNSLIAVRPVDQTFVDTADRRGGCVGNCFDLTVGFLFGKQLRDLQALRDRVYFVDRTDVLKETLAVL